MKMQLEFAMNVKIIFFSAQFSALLTLPISPWLLKSSKVLFTSLPIESYYRTMHRYLLVVMQC